MRNEAKSALDEKYFSPSITQWSPSRRPGSELARIGARLWLGHGEAGDDVAVEERLEILAFCAGVP
jgi:hypothetical protein